MPAKIDTKTVRDLQPRDLPPVTRPVRQSRPLLRGQTALVTGATSGIGRAIAIAMSHAGANVLVNHVQGEEAAEDVIREAAESAREQGVAAPGRLAHHLADVSDERQVEEMFRRTVAEFGTVDILVNNAGIQRDASIEEMTLEQWDAVIGVNLTGQFLCSRAAVREFKRRGVRPEVSCAAGKIVCVSSVHDEIPWAGHVNYAASKGGVSMLMRSIAQEVAPFRIRVNSICPGAIRTPINRPAWESPAAYEELMRLVPYKRIGETDDIARLAVWLASDESDYIVGESIYIDGGMTLYPGFTGGG